MIRTGPDTIRLEGDCPVEDAETLLSALLAAPAAEPDLGGATHIHTAVFQVLLAARRAVHGAPQGAAAPVPALLAAARRHL
jgi:hypothetical protein